MISYPVRYKMLRCSKSELERKNTLTVCMQTGKFLACEQAFRMGYSEICFRNKSRNNPYREPVCRLGSFSHSGSGGRTEPFLSGSSSQHCSIFDDNLSWKLHILHIASKISTSIGIIARLRHFVPLHTLQHI